jgi:hypothetical protein
MDRTTFLTGAEDKLHRANAAQERRRLQGAARAARMQEVADLIKPYDDWFHRNGVRTALHSPGQRSEQLSWLLTFADDIAMTLAL